MSECFSELFLYNDGIKQKDEFDEDILNSGKSLYEVIRIIDGKPLFLERHLNRMENSAKITKLQLWLGKDKVRENILKLISINNMTIGNVKLVFNFNENKVFLAYFLKHHYPEPEAYEKGVDTILYHGERNNPNAKIINIDFRKQVDSEIKAKSAFEAILVDKNGHITEGSKSNIFMIKGREVFTAPLKEVLPGTTRAVIIEVCENIGLKVREEKISYKDIEDFDGLFISGTSPKVLPIRKVDNLEFSSSRNQVLIDIMRAYDEAVARDLEAFK